MTSKRNSYISLLLNGGKFVSASMCKFLADNIAKAKQITKRVHILYDIGLSFSKDIL